MSHTMLCLSLKGGVGLSSLTSNSQTNRDSRCRCYVSVCNNGTFSRIFQYKGGNFLESTSSDDPSNHSFLSINLLTRPYYICILIDDMLYKFCTNSIYYNCLT